MKTKLITLRLPESFPFSGGKEIKEILLKFAEIFSAVAGGPEEYSNFTKYNKKLSRDLDLLVEWSGRYENV